MKQSTETFKNKLLNDSSINTKLRVLAEFNHNRYTPLAAVIGDDWSEDIGPLSSVVEPRRPADGGIEKVRLNSFSRSGPVITSEYRNSSGARRYYFPSESDPYKYWQSQFTPGLDGEFGTPQVITVTYAQNMNVNKIVVCVDAFGGGPKDSKIEVRTGTTWTVISTNPTFGSDGTLTLYRNGSVWSETKNYAGMVAINGVRLTVTSMKSRRYLAVFEISPRLEIDISNYVENGLDANYEISSNTFISPIGETSSNTGSITLSNVDSFFTDDNAASPLKGLVKKNVKITGEVGYEVGSAFEYVRLFTMHVEDWEQGEHDIRASLKDSSMFMQNENPPQMLLTDCTPGAAIWRMLDTMGYSNFNYETSDDDPENTVPYFWTDTEQSLWQNINDLAYGTQTAVYFDEYDVLQIKDGTKALKAATKTWDFTATPGIKAPDIIDIGYEKGFEVNTVKVAYQPTKLSQSETGQPEMRVVWEAEDPTVIRSTELARLLSATETRAFAINKNEVEVWPYEGLVNIEGEVIRYSGKNYGYYRNGTRVYTKITSADKKRSIDASSDQLKKHLNHFTGELFIKERGLFGSVAKEHRASVAKYEQVRYRLNNPTFGLTKAGSMSINPAGYLTQTTNINEWQEIHIVRPVSGGAVVGGLSRAGRYGTRLKIKNTGNQSSGGICLLTNSGSGLYVGIATTDIALRNQRSSINLFTRSPNGNWSSMKPISNDVILPDTWYDIEFDRAANGTTKVYLNGVYRGAVETGWPAGADSSAPYVAVWQRGKCIVDFEYFYGVSEDVNDSIIPVYDLKSGATSSKQYSTYMTTFNKNSLQPKPLRSKGYIFNDFVPVVQEIREFDVQFTENPVVYSNLYFSNSSQVYNSVYNADAFNAKFILHNTARVNAILKGEDTLTLGLNNPIRQEAFVYGRVVERGDEETVTAVNKQAVLSEGKIETEFSSDWIQNKTQATKISDWVSTRFAGGQRIVEMNVFGNPLVQIGDTVGIFYPLKGFGGSNYIITEISHTWNNGLRTRLSLRNATA